MNVKRVLLCTVLLAVIALVYATAPANSPATQQE